MRRGGIPPSADRAAFELRAILIGVGIVVAGLLTLVLFAVQDSSPLDQPPEGMVPPPRTRAEDELQERSSAFNAVQRFVLQVLDYSDILDYAWIDTQHEGHQGYYNYTGIVAIANEEETVTRYKYLVVVELEPDRGWKMLEREVTLADR